MREKIAARKNELKLLNDQFKATVEKTKKQNQENGYLHEQATLLQQLKKKISKKHSKLSTKHKQNKNVISKLESIGYGYQKSYSEKPTGHLKRTVSIQPERKGKAKSLLKRADSMAVDYKVTDDKADKENMVKRQSTKGSRGRALKRYRSVSKTKGLAETAATGALGQEDNMRRSATGLIHEIEEFEDKNPRKGRKKEKARLEKRADTKSKSRSRPKTGGKKSKKVNKKKFNK